MQKTDSDKAFDNPHHGHHEPEPTALHEVVGGPPPESDDFVPEDGSAAPRQSILKLLGETERLTLMEPGRVYDKHILGVGSVNDKLVVVYNEQAVCAAMAIHHGITEIQAWDRLQARKNEIGPNGEAPPVFLTDIADIMVGAI